MSNKIVEFLATFGYIGYFPLAPGSAASLEGMFLYMIFFGHWPVYILVWAAITLLGFLSSGPVEKLKGQKDPSCIVIDEVSGMMIAFFLLPMTMPVMITTFFLFRAFDMFKIYPVYKIEKIPGGRAVMLDDILAGVYTNVVMHIAIRFAGIG